MSKLTTDQAAAALGIQPASLRRYVERGLIRCSRFGAALQFDAKEVERFKDKRRKPGRPGKDGAK